MKVIIVGGFPGSGKSTIMRGAIHKLEQGGHRFKELRQGIITWMESDEVYILGSYKEGEKFPGTDRLPLNVQPEAQRFMEDLKIDEEGQHAREKVVLIEGDRLFNDKFLYFLDTNGFYVILCIVSMSRELLEQRRNKRSDQNESWRKGRETKVNRIALSRPVHHYLQNNTKEEQEQSVAELVKEVRGEWKQQAEVKSKIKSFWS